MLAIRKEKRWAVYTQPDATSGSAWTLELETLSFELAKKKVVELAKTVGIDNIRLERVVDLTTVFLPIT